jgi:transposase
MASIVCADRRVTVGVDTHRDVHVAVVLDEHGGYLGQMEAVTDKGGYRALLCFAREFGEVDAFGIEGTGSYGAGLTRYLTGQGVTVHEIDRPDRRMRRRAGKSDSIDAHAAALAVVSGRAVNPPKSRDGAVESIRTLMVARRSAVRARAQAMNQIRSLLVSAPDKLRTRLAPLGPSPLLSTCAGFRVQGVDTVTDATKLALRTLARRARSLDSEARSLERDIEGLCHGVAPHLLQLHGVGPLVAATLLTTAGDNPERLTSEAGFAHLCGAAPIPASSGLTIRHRLNRGGDRQANNALWRIVMVRMAQDERTQTYVERRSAEGLTKKEIIRCLKRYVAREVYHCLRSRPEALTVP